jgi:hypothetical protein
MRSAQTKQTLRLRLLAFVLALALIWYSLNPLPKPLVRRQQEAEPPEEKKRNLEPQRLLPATLSAVFRPTEEVAERLQFSDEDDFEWPEFIDG